MIPENTKGRMCLYKIQVGASEMVHRIKALSVKSDDLNLILGPT